VTTAVRIIDRGSGVPSVLVPGVQGRWEWMAPAVRALATRARVITFSLADEPSSGWRFDPADGLRGYVEQVRETLDDAGLDRAVICGTSFGGLVAAAFAAAHAERVPGLVLVSALPPSWTPDARVRFYLRAPRLLLPVFCVASLRMFPEMAAAAGGVAAAVGPSLRHVWNVARHPFSPRLMARRARMTGDPALSAAIARTRVPTLIITGEPRLDRVVPVAATADYARLWPHAETATLARTGHLGHDTRPEAFAGLVAGFAERVSAPTDSRRNIG
jgi:pimeloyl-ACP methyl ester carboxylesterase